MKYAVLSLALALMTSAAFAQDRVYYISEGKKTAQFDQKLFDQVAKNWINRKQEHAGANSENRITINKDLTMSVESANQIGVYADPQFPYPTTCLFNYIGQVSEFHTLDDARKKYYADEGRTIPDYDISMKISKVELIVDEWTSKQCQEYVDLFNAGKLQNAHAPFFWIDFFLKDGVMISPWFMDMYDAK